MNAMTLSNKATEEFQRIYRDQYGEEIEEADARDRAERLLRLTRLILSRDQEVAHFSFQQEDGCSNPSRSYTPGANFKS